MRMTQSFIIHKNFFTELNLSQSTSMFKQNIILQTISLYPLLDYPS